MPKRRIMTRGKIFEIINDELIKRIQEDELNAGWRDRSPITNANDRHQAQVDLMAYMLADGDTLKVYNDRDMGGMVVEWQA